MQLYPTQKSTSRNEHLYIVKKMSWELVVPSEFTPVALVLKLHSIIQKSATNIFATREKVSIESWILLFMF
ncbi:hypothetical protein Sjap_002779 [Stephania japonica]|uniref:Uncharacterized protein n=1 Tax=Stephania japonica TaxID=461633 RepID=A0AAP0KP91_9MAGN